MARPRKQKRETREAQLEKRAASRGYTLVKEKDAWYAVLAGTRFGPLQTLDDVDQFLPKEA